MHTAQINSPRFSYQATAPVLPGAVPDGHTLDEFRVLPGRYAGSFSKRSTWPLWAAALIIAAIAGTAFGLYENADRNIATVGSATPSEPTPLGPGATTTDPSLPSAAKASATANVPAPTTATTAKDSAATAPLSPMSKAAEANSMPMAGQANNHSSDSLKPANAKSSMTAKAPVRKVAPAPVNQLAPQQEVVPLAPPPPVKAEEIPPAPAPTPAPVVPTPVPTPAPAPTPQ